MEVGPVSEFSIGEDVLGISDITGATDSIIAIVGGCDGCRVGCFISSRTSRGMPSRMSANDDVKVGLILTTEACFSTVDGAGVGLGG